MEQAVVMFVVMVLVLVLLLVLAVVKQTTAGKYENTPPMGDAKINQHASASSCRCNERIGVYLSSHPKG